MHKKGIGDKRCNGLSYGILLVFKTLTEYQTTLISVTALNIK
jgi:hypothetical protein